MRFLLDSNLSHQVAALLRAAGFDAEHVRDHGLQTAEDIQILTFARRERFVIISEDTDFGELLARDRQAAPSFVLLRTNGPLSPDDQAALLAANLPEVFDDLDRGRGCRTGARADPSQEPAASATDAGPTGQLAD